MWKGKATFLKRSMEQVRGKNQAYLFPFSTL